MLYLLSLFGQLSQGGQKIASDGDEPFARYYFGGAGCIILLVIFFAWCAWRGRQDGEEHGPRL
jgi:hypothetical protein